MPPAAFGVGGRAVAVVAVAGHEHALGHERLLALRQVFRHERQRVQPRVAVGRNPSEQHGGFGQADLGDALRLAATGKLLAFGSGFGQHNGLLGLAA